MRNIILFAFIGPAIFSNKHAYSQKEVVAAFADEKKVINELKKGGYVIYLRHHITRKDQEDSDKKNLKNCSTQRNLSPEGKKGSRQLGAAFKKLGIKVSKVLSSPYCRCLETAKLAFGKASANHDLHFSIGVDKLERKRRADSLLKMLQSPPPKGTNTVIVSHTANLKEAMKIWPKPEGVMHIFQSTNDLTPRYIGKIVPSTWAKYK